MITIVCGMHRSGTSALAGMLHSNGICMGKDGDFYPPPMKENPKGFYENVRFRRVNDAILKRSNYNVKSFNPQIPTIHIVRNEALRIQMTNLIMEYQDDFSHWGWKDPRTSLTILNWLDVLYQMDLGSNDVRIIFMLRPVSEIALSMRMRGNKEVFEGQFEHLAMRYNSRLLVEVQAHYVSIPVMPVIFSDLLNSPKVVADRLSLFVNKQLEDLTFVDPAIARNVV